MTRKTRVIIALLFLSILIAPILIQEAKTNNVREAVVLFNAKRSFGGPQLPWQCEIRGDFTLFWNGEDEQFAEIIFDQIDRSLLIINAELGLVQKAPIRVVVPQREPNSFIVYRTPGGAVYIGYAGVARLEVNESLLGRKVKTFWLWLTIPQANWEETLTHELTHLLVMQNYPTLEDSLPFWLTEGLAHYTEKPADEDARHPAQMSPFLRAVSRSLVIFLMEERGGKEKINQLLTLMAAGTTVDDALQTTYGFDRQGLEREWQDWSGCVAFSGCGVSQFDWDYLWEAKGYSYREVGPDQRIEYAVLLVILTIVILTFNFILIYRDSRRKRVR